jgi:prepilin-type N-terminal cleavage/methylation domain-containing protein
MCRPMNRRRGFTLLELLVGLGLVAVLSGTALLGYRRMVAGWRLNAAARQVVMDLKLARARAILDSTTHRVHFPVLGSSYQHERQQPSGAYVAVGPPTALPSDIAVIGCTGAGSGISFRPRGHAGAFGTITLRNDGGDQRAVVVDIVGRTRVQ